MGILQSIVTYAVKDKGADRWEIKNELVVDFTVQWLIKKFELYHANKDFIFLNEVHIEADDLGSAALERYFHPRGQ